MRKNVWRVDGTGANATEGSVVWAPAKSLWNTAMFGTALIAGPLTASADAIAAFLVLTYVTLLLGHSVGMHRHLIHRTYECSPFLRRLLVYLGVLASGLCFFLWNIGATRVSAGTLAVMNNAKVPLGVACSLLFFGEHANLLTLAASFGLLGGAVCLARSNK